MYSANNKKKCWYNNFINELLFKNWKSKEEFYGMYIRALIAKFSEFVNRSVGIRERLKMDENVFSL